MKLQIFLALILLAYLHQGALAQESRGRDCPVISVYPAAPEAKDTPQIYKATIQGGDSSVTPKFNWTVWHGKITSGQDTSEVTVVPEGNDSITVTVEVLGYAATCQNKASSSWIGHRVMSRKYDEYSDLKFNQERLHLDQFAIALHNEPNSKGHIIVYEAPDSRKPRAAERGERARKYLVKERGLLEAQIVVINGGRRDTRAVELFITPAGALPPTATPK